MIDLYYSGTPNGQKVALMLEEIGLPYQVFKLDIFNGDQLTPEFGRINPNHKIPAIVDQDAPGGPFAVFESGAILQYLAEKAGMLGGGTVTERSAVIQWLTWQMAGLGPMSGQMSHFVRYAPVKIDYAIERYVNEVNRLLAVLEKRLSSSRHLAGDFYSIADIAVWTGRSAAARYGMLDTSKYPSTMRWVEEIASRPAAERLLSKPELAIPEKYTGKTQKLNEEEWSNMFGERMLGAAG